MAVMGPGYTDKGQSGGFSSCDLESPAMVLRTLEEGSVFADRYRVVRKIGSGQMGMVYEVIHLETERPCALKVMLPELVGDEDRRRRFRQEAKISAKIRSEFIVDVFDAGEDPETGSVYLVMEHLEGEELSELLDREGRLEPEEAIVFLRQIAIALDKTHKASVVHRDLKPDNIYVTEREDGSPLLKILDFGVAKILAEGPVGAPGTRSLGTPVYMAPEQFSTGEGLGAASDIFALGMMTYTLLVGTFYWADELGDTENIIAFVKKAIFGPQDPAVERAAGHGVNLPPAFDAWFKKITAFKTEDRFATAGEAVTALAEVFDIPDRSSDRRRRKKVKTPSAPPKVPGEPTPEPAQQPGPAPPAAAITAEPVTLKKDSAFDRAQPAVVTAEPVTLKKSAPFDRAQSDPRPAPARRVSAFDRGAPAPVDQPALNRRARPAPGPQPTQGKAAPAVARAEPSPEQAAPTNGEVDAFKGTRKLSAGDLAGLTPQAVMPFGPAPSADAQQPQPSEADDTAGTQNLSPDVLATFRSQGAMPFARHGGAEPADGQPAAHRIAVVKQDALVAGTLCCRWQPGHALVVIVKATCNLINGDAAKLRTTSEPLAGDEEKSPGGSLLYPSDYAAFKGKADVLLYGHAYVAGGSGPVAQVRFGFGHQGASFERRIIVFGDRQWKHTASGMRASTPQPFVKLRMSYERAFGGQGYGPNPVGRGFRGLPSSDGVARLPNLEDPANLLTDPTQTPSPACFGAISPRWDPQFAHLFDDNWQRTRRPHFPQGFPWQSYQAAPAGQQLIALRGDEPFMCEGLHPKLTSFSGCLPGLVARCFVYGPGRGFAELSLRLDTAIFDFDSMALNLLWRGHVSIADTDGSDVEAVYVSTEPQRGPQLSREQAWQQLTARHRIGRSG